MRPYELEQAVFMVDNIHWRIQEGLVRAMHPNVRWIYLFCKKTEF